jgi:hypothetical protein
MKNKEDFASEVNPISIRNLPVLIRDSLDRQAVRTVYDTNFAGIFSRKHF